MGSRWYLVLAISVVTSASLAQSSRSTDGDPLLQTLLDRIQLAANLSANHRLGTIR